MPICWCSSLRTVSLRRRVRRYKRGMPQIRRGPASALALSAGPTRDRRRARRRLGPRAGRGPTRDRRRTRGDAPREARRASAHRTSHAQRHAIGPAGRRACDGTCRDDTSESASGRDSWGRGCIPRLGGAPSRRARRSACGRVKRDRRAGGVCGVRGGVRARRGDEDEEEAEQHRPQRDPVGSRPDALDRTSRGTAALDLDEARKRRRRHRPACYLDRASGGRACERRRSVRGRRRGVARLRRGGRCVRECARRPRRGGGRRSGRLHARGRGRAAGRATRMPTPIRRRVLPWRRANETAFGRRVRGHRPIVANGATALDRLAHVLNVGPPCLGLALGHACLSSFRGLRG